MKLLLDTHIFLWFISGDKRLPKGMRDSIRDLNNEAYLSVVSLWEAMVKYQLGKLPLPQPPNIYLPIQRQKHQIDSLPLDEARKNIGVMSSFLTYKKHRGRVFILDIYQKMSY